MNETKIKLNYKLKFLLQMHQIFQSLIKKIIVNFELQNKKIMRENISSQLTISMKSMSPLILSPGNLKQSVANTLDCSFVSQFSIAEQSKENINNQNVAEVFRKERAHDRIAVSKQLIPQDIEQTEKQKNPKGCLQSVDQPIQMISVQLTEENIFHQINNSGNSDKQISEISSESIITEKTKNSILNQNGTDKDKLSDYRNNNGIEEVDSKVSMIRQCNRVQSFLKQKDFIRKQKKEIKRQYEQSYNKLWSQSIKKDHIIIRLELRNNDLQKQVKEGNEQLEQLKKGSKRQLKLLKNQFQTEINELISENKQNQEKIKQSYELKLKFLTDKFETLEEESKRINAEKESMETRFRKKLEEVTQDGIQLARRVKQCMERKLLIVEERHQSQLQALRQEHRLQCQIFQSELTDYKYLLQAKTQIIREQSILIEDLSPMNLSQQPVASVDDFSQNQQIESKQIQLSELIKFIAVKLQEQKERQIQIIKQNYEDKFKKLVEKNMEMEKEMEEVRERLRMRLNAAQMPKISQIERTKGAQIDKIDWTSEDKLNYQQKQQESIEEKQQTFSPIKSKNEGTNQAQYELLKKDLTLTRTQLSLCRQQLSFYQSIIESLQLQLSQLQSSNQQLSQKNDGLTNLLDQKKKEPLTDENPLEITLSRNDFNQEWNRQESLFVKSMEEEFNFKYHQLQLAYGKLQDQHSRTNSELHELKKQSFQTKVQHQALRQQYQKLKEEVFELQKSDDQTRDFIQELKKIHQLNMKQTRNSYDRLLLQRQQEVEQLSLIIGQVIKQNFEIRRNYNILKHEGDRKKQSFNEDNINQQINQ